MVALKAYIVRYATGGAPGAPEQPEERSENCRPLENQNLHIEVILAGGAVVLLTQLASSSMGYLTQLFLARWMGSLEYGVYTFAMALALLLGMHSALGFDTAVLRFIPGYLREKAWAELRGLIRRSEQFTILTGVGIAVAGSLASWCLGDRLENARVMVLAFWAVPLFGLGQLQRGEARALTVPLVAYLPLSLVYRLLLLGGTFALWWRMGKLSAMAGIVATLTGLIIALVSQRLAIQLRLAPTARTARSVYNTGLWVRTALPLLLSSGMEVLRSRLDLLLLGAMRPFSEVGIYDVADRTATLVSLMVAAVSALGAPAFASLYAERRRESLQRSLSLAAHWVFWPSLAIATALCWFAGPTLSLFGPRFVNGRSSLMLLLIAHLVDAGVGPVGYLLSLTGYQNQVARVTFWTVAGSLVLDCVLIPAFGFRGAAVAAAASLTISNLWLHLLVQERLSLKPSIVHALRQSLRR